MYTQLWPSGEFLTNHVALLWVEAGQPWYITFPEAMNVTRGLITAEMSQFFHRCSPICLIRNKHPVCDAVLPPWRGIWYVENSHHVSHISVAATIVWRGIWYVENSHHVSHISVAATIAWRGIWYVENSHHVSHISVAATIAWRGIWYVENNHHVSHISVAAAIAWRGIWYVENSHHVSQVSVAATIAWRDIGMQKIAIMCRKSQWPLPLRGAAFSK